MKSHVKTNSISERRQRGEEVLPGDTETQPAVSSDLLVHFALEKPLKLVYMWLNWCLWHEWLVSRISSVLLAAASLCFSGKVKANRCEMLYFYKCWLIRLWLGHSDETVVHKLHLKMRNLSVSSFFCISKFSSCCCFMEKPEQDVSHLFLRCCYTFSKVKLGDQSDQFLVWYSVLGGGQY